MLGISYYLSARGRGLVLILVQRIREVNVLPEVHSW